LFLAIIDQTYTAIEFVWDHAPVIATGALGTIFGAWLSSRAGFKRKIIDELKGLRAAYALCQTITMSAFNIKSQHIWPMKKRFNRAQIDFIIAHWNRTPVNLALDLNTLSQMNFPSDRLVEHDLREVSGQHEKYVARGTDTFFSRRSPRVDQRQE
jgi:hypothetical protein